METVPIGPSTGWLCGKEQIIPRNRQEEILDKAGASAFEVVLLGTQWDLEAPRMKFLRECDGFQPRARYRSVHLPDIERRDGPKQMQIAAEAVKLTGATTAVSHILRQNGTYSWTVCRQLMGAGIPLAMENMDSRKDSSITLDDLLAIHQSLGCKFVLDVQHAYEHDKSMQYGRCLVDWLHEPLVHLHVSGQTATNRHELVCRAENAAEIVELVGYALERKPVPIILEGKFSNEADLLEETTFLKKELGI